MIQLTVVDSFTHKPFAGNPAAVCRLPSPAPAEWMQKVAAEMNLSETAFVHPQDDAYGIRWFTPAVEVDLCGHATLAAAYVLWQTEPSERLKFHSHSGVLEAFRRQDGWIRLDFPATPPQQAQPPEDLLSSLGCQALWVGRSRLDYLVEVENEARLRALQPDFARLARVTARGVIVTAAGEDYDFVSRFFAPSQGIAEDPVTGSAHCTLAPYWAARLKKSQMLAYQASSRGGVVRVEDRGDRVYLEGQAVEVWRGQWLADGPGTCSES